MGKVMKGLSALILCSIFVIAPRPSTAWVQDGSEVTTANNNQVNISIVPDGGGGAIIIWQDYRNNNDDLYAQRIDGFGNRLWSPSNGVEVCRYAGGQSYPVSVPDGEGGAIIVWQDTRGAFSDIYAQRVDASGAVLWTMYGVPLCTAAYGQINPRIISDGFGGAIVAWEDMRGGSSSNWDIYSQRVDASGNVLWTADGVPLCTLASNQSYPSLASDGDGGAIVAWQDLRGGNNDIYAQAVDSTGTVQWTVDGVALCSEAAEQKEPRIVPDGAGGAIVTWYDERSASYFLFGQRVDASGAIQWATDGVSLTQTSNSLTHHVLLPDGCGGAYIVHSAARMGDYVYDVYAQRLDGSGAVQWGVAGVTLCAASGNQVSPSAMTHPEGGLIAAWSDFRGSTQDIYSQRVDGTGLVRWLPDGIVLCSAGGTQSYSAMASDGAGGAIVAWQDYRTGSDIYAQLIDGEGRKGLFQPGILSVADLPGDQGGRVRITIDASVLDGLVTRPIATYNVWQRIDDLSALALPDAEIPGISPDGLENQAPTAISFDADQGGGEKAWPGLPVESINGRIIIHSQDFTGSAVSTGETWELVGSFAACQYEQYTYRAGTLADSTANGIPYSVYMVSAHTTYPPEWYMSDPDSGYSVDNLPPEPPSGLVAQQSFEPAGLSLGWDPNTANDISHYAVYRGGSADFVPAPENRIAETADVGCFDADWRWDSGFFYKVSALDIHGNESGFALLQPDGVTGDEIPPAPAASYINQNFPNPFNPSTRIEFGLATAGRVSLRIYDAAGRLVRVVADEERAAGHYVEVWDGKDGDGCTVSSGVYFCRLDAGTFTRTRKLVLLK